MRDLRRSCSGPRRLQAAPAGRGSRPRVRHRWDRAVLRIERGRRRAGRGRSRVRPPVLRPCLGRAGELGNDPSSPLDQDRRGRRGHDAGCRRRGELGIRPDPVAVGWGLLASLCYALHYLFGARYFPRYEPGTLFVWILAIGAIGLGPFVRFGDKGPVAWSAILYVAALPTYVAYRLYAAGLPRVAPTRAATVASAEPVIAALFAWLTFGESLGAIGYLGAALVVVGVALSATGGSSRRQAGGREPR
jgi:drug/metabolite transporter (DMT)-like permease